MLLFRKLEKVLLFSSYFDLQIDNSQLLHVWFFRKLFKSETLPH